MTEQEFNKLKFREVAHITSDDRYSAFYECVSEILADRLKVVAWYNRDKQTGIVLDEKPKVVYLLDRKMYRNKKNVLEIINQI